MADEAVTETSVGHCLASGAAPLVQIDVSGAYRISLVIEIVLSLKKQEPGSPAPDQTENDARD